MKCLSLKKYLNETSLHGFGYTDDKNVFFIVSWSILTAVCIACAIHDINGVVGTYLSVPSSLEMSVAPNENLNLVTPTLCMEFEPALVGNFIIDDINNDIKAFMAATNNGMNLGIENSQMNLTNRLEYITYLMLGYITDFELLYTGETRFTLTDYVIRYPIKSSQLLQDNNDHPPRALQYTSFLQTVYDTYMSYKVPLGNLKRLVGMSICRKQIGSARYGPLLGNVTWAPVASICQTDTITHLSFSLLCIKLFNSSTFRPTNGFTVKLLQLNSSSTQRFPGIHRTHKCQDNVTQAITKKYVRFLWRFDLQGRSVTPQLSLQDIVSLDPAIPGTRLEAFVASEYKFVDVPTIRDCSNGERQRDCIWRKTVEQMSQTCTCWPSTLMDVVNTKQMPTCSDNPANPNLNITGRNNYLKCNETVAVDTTACFSDCNSYIYSVSQLTTRLAMSVGLLGLETRTNGGSVEIKFQSATSRYLFVESLTMPFTSFACSFGGIIGTYMGGSILAFVHIPIFMLAQLTNLLGKRKRVENSEKADEKVINLSKEEIYPPVRAEAKVV